ncbi:MAG: AbrB/MazE/SpoVT family DNA-binding domain-containing protein [Hyphomicrobiales bacterium]|nr:AbrB/MazE/SpoVT family DNA-binding domain-containing protein [Hyphomicrobiales bacterium]
MSQATIGKWGKSLGVRIPADIARSLGLDVGSDVEIVAGEGEIVVRPVARPRSLRDLLGDKSPEEWRALYRGSAVDWGPDVGREIIEE